MNTWISKPVLWAACLLALGACDTLPAGGGFNLLQAGTSGLGGASAPTRQASMADGAVILVAPFGYCVDQKSNKAQFALIARCDVLGDASTGYAGPAAILTASLTADDTAQEIGTDTLIGAGDMVLDKVEHKGMHAVRLKGSPPKLGLNTDYWRGAGRVGDHILGLSLYSAADQPVIGPYGRDLIIETLIATRAASPDAVAKTQ